MTKFCKDCTHVLSGYGSYDYKCLRDRKVERSLVTGQTHNVGPALYCNDERKPRSVTRLFVDRCGPEGKYFERKIS